jgi:hypothetical protein
MVSTVVCDRILRRLDEHLGSPDSWSQDAKESARGMCASTSVELRYLANEEIGGVVCIHE